MQQDRLVEFLLVVLVVQAVAVAVVALAEKPLVVASVASVVLVQ
jgi:hypothetical protein